MKGSNADYIIFVFAGVGGGNFQVVGTLDIVLGKVEYHQETVEDTGDSPVTSKANTCV